MPNLSVTFPNTHGDIVYRVGDRDNIKCVVLECHAISDTLFKYVIGVVGGKMIVDQSQITNEPEVPA